jgi:ABC-2 type transport system ATP-binding protein
MHAARNLAVEASGLVKTYAGGLDAVRGVSLRIPAGSLFGLLGPDGAGKSTIVRLLTTLSTPTSGTATVAGHDIAREPAAVRRLIGYVAQQSGVEARATGLENLMLRGRIHGLRGRELSLRTMELLDRLALTDIAHDLAATYCLGAKRKLDVAMALIHRPQVLFLDEPTGGLDPEARVELREQIRELAWDWGMTVLFTTPSAEEAEELAQRFAVISGGRVIAEGTPDELRTELYAGAAMPELAL